MRLHPNREKNYSQNNIRSASAKYKSVKHVLPTSNYLERLFSHVKLFYTDHRRSMSPINLEMCSFLHANKDWWDAYTVEETFSTYPAGFWQWHENVASDNSNDEEKEAEDN